MSYLSTLGCSSATGPVRFSAIRRLFFSNLSSLTARHGVQFPIIGILVLFCISVPAFSQVPQSNHVVVVMDENHSFSEVQANMPWLVSQGNANGFASNYHSDNGGSLFDYLWIASGSCHSAANCTLIAGRTHDFGCSGNSCTSAITDDNIFRELNNRGISWKVYAQSYTAAGGTVTTPDQHNGTSYYRRHNGATWYSDILSNVAGSQAKIVDFSQFATDLANNALPQYSIIVPDGAHDAHDCPSGAAACLQAADDFLNTNLTPMLAKSYFQPGGDGLLFVTFDECGSATNSGCNAQVYTAVIGPQVKPHTQSTTFYKHENLLRTTLDALGVTTYPGASINVTDMNDFFGGSVGFDPSSFNFGSQTVNTTSAAHNFTLNNTTPNAISGLSITTSGDFAQTNGCGTSLAAGATCTVSVTFTPTATGTRSGVLTASYTGGSATASLTGTGQPVSSGDLSDNAWSCTGSCAAAVSDSTIQLDGASTKLGYTGGTAFSSGTWSQTLSSSYNTQTQFTLDFWAYMDNPTASQAVEFHILQHTGTQFYPFKVQCDFKNSTFWRVYDPPTNSWVSTGVGCAVFTANSWNHFTLNFERTSGNQLHYQNIVINGNTYTFEKLANPLSDTSAASVALETTLIGDGVPDTYSMWLDKMTLAQQAFNGDQNLDDGSWTCSGNCTTPTADTTNQLDGASIKFPYTGGAAFTSATFSTVPAGDFSTATNYSLEFWSFITNPTASQALEVYARQVIGGNSYPFQIQCDFKDSGKWRVWDPVASNWVATTRNCVVFTANSWDHFILHFNRVGTQLVYQDIVINGVTYSFNVTVNATSTTASNSMTVLTRLVGDSAGTAYSWWLDQMSLTF